MLSRPGTNGASKSDGFSFMFFIIFSFGIAKLIFITLFFFSNNYAITGMLQDRQDTMMWLSSITISDSSAVANCLKTNSGRNIESHELDVVVVTAGLNQQELRPLPQLVSNPITAIDMGFPRSLAKQITTGVK